VTTLRLLDYGTLNPFGETIGRPSRLAWPVNAYRVTLPREPKDGDGLNPFERVVLKLLAAVGAIDAHTISDESRIPLDLVKGIILRLRDKELIDEHNVIMEIECNSRKDYGDNIPVFVTALLFRELATGRILPFLHFLDDTNPLRQKEESEKDYYRTICWEDLHKRNLPLQHDVINALRAMKRRSQAFGNDVRSLAINQITIASTPELYHLECPIAVQKSDGEFRIADPFGNGFSLVLESAFLQTLEEDAQLNEWLLKWKNSLRNPRPRTEDGTDERAREPYENDANWQRFPKLLAKLRPSRTSPFRSMSKIHASLEWALFYACCRRPFGDTITRLRLSRQADHPALIWKVAQSLGLECSEADFRPILSGRLMNFEEGRVDLDTVLAIAVLQSEKDSFHPLRSIAHSHPNFITHLLGIKRARDAKDHGEGGADAPKAELPDDSFMRKVVHRLLPEVSFADSPSDEGDRDVLADSLLDARASIQGEFGFRFFNRLGANLQDRLIHAERFWLALMDRDGDDASTFANDLYAALQAAFSGHLLGKLPPDLADNQLVGTAKAIAQNYNLGELSECLTTVRPLAIRQTLQGSAQSLGACVISFLLMADDDALDSLAACHPAFITDVSSIITLRLHGNEPMPMLRQEISELRKAAYSSIKLLIET